MHRITVAISVLMLSMAFGCSSVDQNQNYGKTYLGSSFNSETYVWEGLYFPTNRVIDRR